LIILNLSTNTISHALPLNCALIKLKKKTQLMILNYFPVKGNNIKSDGQTDRMQSSSHSTVTVRC
jgi:hypothetical protein